MIDLDDASTFTEGDPGGALAAVEHAPEQWLEGIRRARDTAELPTRHGINSVVFCGMGGSGIAGDVVAAVAARSANVPCFVVKDYSLPAFVGPNTLVLCSSYSGNTEETLSCFNVACERKARVVAITTGGTLARYAVEHNVPIIAPVEGLQPRFALPSLLSPALIVLDRLGVLDVTEDLAEAHDVLAGRARALGRTEAASDNEAKTLAQQLFRHVPMIWGQDSLGPAALRWRAQLNENAKVPASHNVFPELDHNEIMAFDPTAPAVSDLAVVVLRAPGADERMARRIEATLSIVRDQAGLAVEAWSVGETPLARILSSMVLGDFVSVYLALLRGVDPSQIPNIEELKRRLA